MSWYDYIPIAGSVTRLAKGEYGHALADLAPIVGPAGYDAYNAYTGAMGEQRKGLGMAADQMRALGERQKQFQMEGLDRAENYYQPAVAMNKAVYGTPDKMRK